MTEAYPLAWPPGWPRTSMDRRCGSKFSKSLGFSEIGKLQAELRRLGATHVVISTNIPVRQDGLPYADYLRRRLDDPGVAVYFKLKGKPLSMARDRYWTPWENLHSLVLAIEAMRSIERHGGSTMMERAFDGFAALPPPDDCWKVLGIDLEVITRMRKAENFPGECRTLIQDLFRQAARVGHGTGADMDRLVKARDEALEKIDA